MLLDDLGHAILGLGIIVFLFHFYSDFTRRTVDSRRNWMMIGAVLVSLFVLHIPFIVLFLVSIGIALFSYCCTPFMAEGDREIIYWCLLSLLVFGWSIVFLGMVFYLFNFFVFSAVLKFNKIKDWPGTPVLAYSFIASLWIMLS